MIDRVAVTSCAYNSDGSLIVGGLRDGSIQLWGAKGERVGRSAAIELVRKFFFVFIRNLFSSGSTTKASNDPSSRVDVFVECRIT